MTNHVLTAIHEVHPQLLVAAAAAVKARSPCANHAVRPLASFRLEAFSGLVRISGHSFGAILILCEFVLTLSTVLTSAHY